MNDLIERLERVISDLSYLGTKEKITSNIEDEHAVVEAVELLIELKNERIDYEKDN